MTGLSCLVLKPPVLGNYLNHQHIPILNIGENLRVQDKICEALPSIERYEHSYPGPIDNGSFRDVEGRRLLGQGPDVYGA